MNYYFFMNFIKIKNTKYKVQNEKDYYIELCLASLLEYLLLLLLLYHLPLLHFH